MTKTIGVLAMQGNLEEHEDALLLAMHNRDIKGGTIRIKNAPELKRTDALVIGGGESTTMWKLLKKTNLFSALKKYEKPILGTCAGMILLAKSGTGDDSKKTKQEFLKKIDVVVKRNAFGRQVDSFSEDLDFDGRPFHAVFIRAPVIEKVGTDVEILSKYGGKIVAAKQGNILVTAFHPELTDDSRIHEYFLGMI